MKKMIAMMLVVVFVAVTSAQAGGGHCKKETKKTDKYMSKMVRDLKLSDEQKVQFDAIMTDKRAKKDEIKKQEQAAMDVLHAEVKAKLSGVLSAEQLQAWEARKSLSSRHARGKVCPMGEGKKCSMCDKGKTCAKCQGNKGYIVGCPDCQDGKKCPRCLEKAAKGEPRKSGCPYSSGK